VGDERASAIALIKKTDSDIGRDEERKVFSYKNKISNNYNCESVFL